MELFMPIVLIGWLIMFLQINVVEIVMENEEKSQRTSHVHSQYRRANNIHSFIATKKDGDHYQWINA